MKKSKEQVKFFITILCLSVFVCFICLKHNYQILNFFNFKTGISLTAKQVLRQYVRAMEKGDYETAYNHLSHDSQTRHSSEEFICCFKDGVTEYDLGWIRKAYQQDNKLRLEILILGDPGTWHFDLIKEGKWKIVWQRGRPYFTYPDNFFCTSSD